MPRYVMNRNEQMIEIDSIITAEFITEISNRLSENKQVKQLVRERLEETQMLRGILG